MRLLNKLWPGKASAKNVIANKIAIPLPTDKIKERLKIPVTQLEIKKEEFVNWQKRFYPESEQIFKSDMHKKMLELYISYQLLNIEPEDVYMDAAGGQYSYASRIDCKKKIIQDIRLSDKLKNFHGNNVTYLDCSCAEIPLPEKSVNKISCHHSIEHFQQNADIDFMKELQRIMAHGGKCVILPIFISSKALLIADQTSFNRWNEEGEWLIDETATLPGGAGSGHFSRVYSPESLTNRLINQFNSELFKLQLVSVKMNTEEIPNENQFMTEKQAIMNYFYRALVIERV